MRTSNLFRILTPLALTVTLAAACGASDNSSAGAREPDTTADASKSDAIVIDGFRFSVPVSVKSGAKVEVRNEDGADHTVTSDDDLFDTATVDGKGTGSFVAPSQPGTYAFHCEIHPSMKGTLVVT